MNKINFYWAGYQSNDNKIYEKAAMLIPVKTVNHENLAMQFDLGIAKSVIYRNRFQKIIKDTDAALIFKKQLFNNNLEKNDRLYLKTGEVVQDSFVLIDYNVDSDVKDIEKKQLSPYDAITVGSLGANFLNNNFVYIDFVNQYIQKQPISFKKKVLSKNTNVIKTKIWVKFNLILLPVIFQEKEYLVIFDTGSSLTTLNLVGDVGVNLINKKSFTDTTAVNSWGKKILLYGKNTNESIKISNFPIRLKTIQFTDPASKIAKSLNELNKELQEEGEKLPYVIGVIGNKLFLDRQILIDYQEQTFYIF